MTLLRRLAIAWRLSKLYSEKVRYYRTLGYSLTMAEAKAAWFLGHGGEPEKLLPAKEPEPETLRYSWPCGCVTIGGKGTRKEPALDIDPCAYHAKDGLEVELFVDDQERP